MAKQHFTEKDIDQIMGDQAVAILSGWTEANDAEPCDENVYRQKLAANHEGYMAKIQEALDSVSDTARATE